MSSLTEESIAKSRRRKIQRVSDSLQGQPRTQPGRLAHPSRDSAPSPFHPFQSMYNPRMKKLPWHTVTLGALLVISLCTRGAQQTQSPEPEKPKPPVKVEQRGRVVGIGGVFFKSANRNQTRDWYAQHLGLVDKGSGAMLPWREHDDPQKEHVTSLTVFGASSKYFDGPLMIDYIVDDMDAMLERLKDEGVKIDPKRMNESFGSFAWIYDPDGNKIELWQPAAKP